MHKFCHTANFNTHFHTFAVGLIHFLVILTASRQSLKFNSAMHSESHIAAQGVMQDFNWGGGETLVIYVHMSINFANFISA